MSMENKILSAEPYRYLFPLGALVGLVSAALWIFFQQQWVVYYPRTSHGNLMFFGFFWAFIAGFLMTAIPKMTDTKQGTRLEILVLISFVVGQLILNLTKNFEASVLLFAVQNIVLVSFILKRFLINKKMPFAGFVFVPMAFVQLFLGVVLYSLFSIKNRDLLMLLSGEAFILNLILGVGSRLVPVISKIPGALLPTEHKNNNSWISYIMILLILNLSYWIQTFLKIDGMELVRVFVLGLAGFILFKIHRKPVKWGVLGFGLKASFLLIILGQALAFTGFKMSLAGQHVLYIGGLSLITFLISFRVILAHGGQDLNYEVSSKRIALILVLFVSAALSRLAAGNYVQSEWMTIAAIIFIFAVILWFVKFCKIYYLPQRR